jgi:hypothetical protein
MNEEWITSDSGRTLGYATDFYNAKHCNDYINKPINALTFDVIDLSDNVPDQSTEYNWLTKMILEMPDKEAMRKMKSFSNSFSDIDDGVVEKVIMEAL